MIIDLHAHLLPGIDDGAADYEASLELARLAVDEGVSHMVLTPHHHNGQYINHKKDVEAAVNDLKAVYAENHVDLKLYAGQEIRITENFLDYLYNGDLLSLDPNRRYYLLEFPTASVPDFALSLLKDLVDQGITPVIAHPERNHVFAKNPNLLYEYISAGCLAQLTTSSYAGLYGEKLQAICRELIELNLVHIVASDVHHIKHRPMNMQAAFGLLEQEYGQGQVAYFKGNARAIFNGDNVAARKPSKKKKKWFKFF